MDLKEIKKLSAYMRRAGIKKVRYADVEVELSDMILTAMSPRERSKPTLVPDADHKLPKPIPEPTLEQINEYIYGHPAIDETA
jgi:hypothetical protein